MTTWYENLSKFIVVGMSNHRAKYGFYSGCLIIISFVAAWYFEKNNFVELGGVAVIIYAMFIWHKDFESYSINDTNIFALETEVRNNLKELAEHYRDIREVKTFTSLETNMVKLQNIIEELGVSDFSTGERSYKHHYMLTKSVAANQHFIIQLKLDLDRRLDMLASSMRSIIRIKEHTEVVKKKFVNIELELVIYGTIYWALGGYVYQGYFQLLH